MTQSAKYPLAVEKMTMAFEHAFETSALVGLSKSSAEDPDLYSVVIFADGKTTKRFETGEVLSYPVETWLEAANVSLTAKNAQVRPDDTGRKPPLRTSGVNVIVDIAYTNINLESGRAEVGKTSVHAHVTLTQKAGTWAGAGGARPESARA